MDLRRDHYRLTAGTRPPETRPWSPPAAGPQTIVSPLARVDSIRLLAAADAEQLLLMLLWWWWLDLIEVAMLLDR